jgi:hypothetical protein
MRKLFWVDGIVVGPKASGCGRGWGNIENMVDLDENELYYYELAF